MAFEVCECGGLLWIFFFVFLGGVGGCGFVPVVAICVVAAVVGGRCCGSGGCAIVVVDDDNEDDRE